MRPGPRSGAFRPWNAPLHGEARGLELGRELLAWRNGVATGRPKDFRTWHATVLAAAGPADARPTPRAEWAVLELLG